MYCIVLHCVALHLNVLHCIILQLSLHSMLGGSAASSFADDIMKWQKTLQNLEAVLNLWWEAQQKWIKLDDVSIKVHQWSVSMGKD